MWNPIVGHVVTMNKTNKQNKISTKQLWNCRMLVKQALHQTLYYDIGYIYTFRLLTFTIHDNLPQPNIYGPDNLTLGNYFTTFIIFTSEKHRGPDHGKLLVLRTPLYANRTDSQNKQYWCSVIFFKAPLSLTTRGHCLSSSTDNDRRQRSIPHHTEGCWRPCLKKHVHKWLTRWKQRCSFENAILFGLSFSFLSIFVQF